MPSATAHKVAPGIRGVYTNRISPEKIAAVKAATPIADLVSEFVDLRRNGSRLAGSCPGHLSKSRRSFQVSPEFNFWKCWGGCGEGDPLDFVQWHLRLSFIDGVKYLAQRASFDLDAPVSSETIRAVAAAREQKEKDEQIRIAERGELVRLGRELSDVRALLRNAGRRVSEIERGSAVLWPDEKESCIEVIAMATEQLRDLDCEYCLLAFGAVEDRRRYIEDPAARTEMVSMALARGHVMSDRGVRHAVPLQ